MDGFSDTHQITLIQLGVEQILEKKKTFSPTAERQNRQKKTSLVANSYI